MLSITQRARLLEVIPTDLADLTVKLLRKDRLGNDDYVFPSMRINIISQGIRVRPNTWAPIRKNYDGYQGDVIQYLGQHQQATISITLLAESVTAGTDQTTPETLDQMVYDLQKEIEIYRLGLYWPTDYMKVVPGSGKVTYLPPFQAKASDEHWIYPAVFDFRVEYEFNVLDETPNIHAIDYEWSLSDLAENKYINLVNAHPPWYSMDVCLRGWYRSVEMDMLLLDLNYGKSYGMDIILISE
jgi:hypothetical protein